VVHGVRTLVGQRIVGIACGYEDVNDHDQLRFDPVLSLPAFLTGGGSGAALEASSVPATG
jgi:hypothetical protein